MRFASTPITSWLGVRIMRPAVVEIRSLPSARYAELRDLWRDPHGTSTAVERLMPSPDLPALDPDQLATVIGGVKPAASGAGGGDQSQASSQGASTPPLDGVSLGKGTKLASSASSHLGVIPPTSL
jgi:hypothetical protein